MIQRVASRIKQIGFFYLVFGAGWFGGCFFTGFMLGLGRLH